MSYVEENITVAMEFVESRTGFKFHHWRFEHDNRDRIMLVFMDSRFRENLPCELTVNTHPFDQSWKLQLCRLVAGMRWAERIGRVG